MCCDICETPRSGSTDPLPNSHPSIEPSLPPQLNLSPPPQDALPQMSWECGSCTLLNGASDTVCDACGGPRLVLPATEEEQLQLALAQSRAEQSNIPSGSGPVGLSPAWTAASEEQAIVESLREAHGPKPPVASSALRVAGDSRGSASTIVGLTPEEALELAMLKSRVAAEEPPDPKPPPYCPNPPVSTYQRHPTSTTQPLNASSATLAPLPPLLASKVSKKPPAVGLKESLLHDEPLLASNLPPVSVSYQSNYQPPVLPVPSPAPAPEPASNIRGSTPRHMPDTECEEDWDDADRPLNASGLLASSVASLQADAPHPNQRPGGTALNPGAYAQLE